MGFKLTILALLLVGHQLTLCDGENEKNYPSRIATPQPVQAQQSDPDLNVLHHAVNSEGNLSNSSSQNLNKNELQGQRRPALDAAPRKVHTKGAGAHGFFEVTHDISNSTRAAVFAGAGKRTPIFVRFSTASGEAGSADTTLDPRGFAIKFYTEHGNWDLVGNNFPVFPIRDLKLFSSFGRSRQRNPQTHLKDPNTVWDFISLRPESTLHTLQLFSDLGFPDGCRFMNGAAIHTFKFVNKAREAVYVKFHWLSQQGVKNLTRVQAKMLAGLNPDYSTQDLFEAIDRKEFPSWNLMIQVMTFDQASKYRWNPFDITKEWLTDEFPLIPVGRMTLNRNPKDYFTETEIVAFNPGNLVPGIEMSPDPILQARSFAYLDAQRHRLGANFPQLSINRPKIPLNLQTYERDGPSADPERAETEHQIKKSAGDVQRVDVGDDDNFSQAKIYLGKMPRWERERLVDNLADSIKMIDEGVRERTLAYFRNVDEDFGRQVKMAAEKMIAEAKLKAPGTTMYDQVAMCLAHV